ncbi:MAG: hypothetical protein Q8Q96_00870 [bacterium]|nr:hypothetical protein [bacterium]
MSIRFSLLRHLNMALFTFMFLNLLFLNIWVFQKRAREPIQTVVHSDESSKFKEEVSKIYETIQEATASVRLLLTPVPGSVSESLSSIPSSTKEFFVPLGSGTNIVDEWTDVAGAQAYIDRSQYGSIKSVVFEASVYIPTGNQIVWVRLFNVTDKHPVWLSEMSHEGGAPKLLVSKPITLDSGNKLYQVQMKNQLKDKVNLVQSRVRITTY